MRDENKVEEEEVNEMKKWKKGKLQSGIFILRISDSKIFFFVLGCDFKGELEALIFFFEKQVFFLYAGNVVVLLLLKIYCIEQITQNKNSTLRSLCNVKSEKEFTCCKITDRLDVVGSFKVYMNFFYWTYWVI